VLELIEILNVCAELSTGEQLTNFPEVSGIT
jgi:hypothetical protein